MSSFKYIGCFLDKCDVKKYAEQQSLERLDCVIEHPHVTFVYKPEMVPCELFGLNITIRVTSYGNNGENEAFGIVFENLPKELVGFVQLIEVPHITISVSENGESVNSRNLKFAPIKSFCLQGVFGGKDYNGFVHTNSSNQGTGL